MVINDIPASAPQPLQAIKLLASLRAGKCTPEEAKAKFAEWLSSGDAASSNDPTTRALAAALALADGDFVGALRACHGGSSSSSKLTPELRAISVQALLAADRPELAERWRPKVEGVNLVEATLDPLREEAAAELLVRAYHVTYGLNVSSTRCSNNSGPYQFPEKVIWYWVESRQRLSGEIVKNAEMIEYVKRTGTYRLDIAGELVGKIR